MTQGNIFQHKPLKGKAWRGQPFTHAQHKLDGWRAQFFVQESGRIMCWGRNHSPHLEFFERYPSLKYHPFVDRLYELKLPPETSIDCEIMVASGDRSKVVSALKEGPEAYTIHAFAIPYFGGTPYFDEPLDETMAWCDEHGIARVETLPGMQMVDGRKRLAGDDLEEAKRVMLDAAARAGVEGWMLKSGGQYGKWYKLKPEPTIDCIITGTIPGQGKYQGLVGAIVCSVWDGKDGHTLREVASASGMTDEMRNRMSVLANHGQLLGKVAELEYQIIGAGGRLIHPRFVRMRFDKPAEECTVDQLKESDDD